MAEQFLQNVSIRITSCRSTASENGNSAPRSCRVPSEMCFGEEWMDDGEEEAFLQALDLDVLENNECDNTSTSKEQTCCKYLNDKTEQCTSCACKLQNTHIKCNHGNSTSTVTDDENEVCREEDVCKKCQEAETCSKKRENELSLETACESKVLQKKMKPDFVLTPLKQFKGHYLWVSDLTAQAWCERQLLYDCTFEGPIELLETDAMKVGSELHLKREREVHDIKQIVVNTKEDKWAIKILNILNALHQLIEGAGGGRSTSRCVIREMPIFGTPFQTGIFVVGVIDEIRYDNQDQLQLVEFKTRAKARSVPSKAQRKTHKLQVMLYKQLFDEAVCGLLSKGVILETTGLDPTATVNNEVAAHAEQLGIESKIFGDYLDTMLERFQFLQSIRSLMVEYTSQDDCEPFAVNEYEFDPVWLKEKLEHYNAFWEGKREVVGVDVEDVWKCNFCMYKEECDWRKKMHEECVTRNSASRIQIEITQ